ncbi:putative oxidoreductase [Okibacterium sp. HSC-33S16]|uniref:FAD-binding dehydrogenase n=1 Tax=Okibacterium sp. HSC-33S16 TaxID=2910965 RepID=UPI00209CED6E|nr:FAD-binding dehydrogenase [Okibacterium sp. HSC-33S16]MCP2030623.1 putative oxidoreductase [Okibacterium sp. HSC-33S16]
MHAPVDSAGSADVIVVGAGLAGLVAAAELSDADRQVLLVDQEPEASLGGQAWWSFGGLFLVDTPEQRRMGITDSRELALQDWAGSAAFDRPEDAWGRRWAEAYVDFAAGEKRSWLTGQGLSFFPVVGWAERGGYIAGGHGNSVPRFHIVWGTGPGVVAPFARRVSDGVRAGRIRVLHRHRVDDLVITNGSVTGVRGRVLAASTVKRGVASGRDEIDDFELSAQAVVVTTGGIGGNHDRVRAQWPARLGTPPTHMLSGVPASVDGHGIDMAARAGARLVNGDRMWHYTEGITNYDPAWASHGIRILPGPSSVWLDATGKRLPAPLFPGFDTLGTLEYLRKTGHDHSWFVLTQKIIEKEFALSGSEQNPDLTDKDLKLLLKRVAPGAPGPVEAFKQKGEDFVVARTLPELLAGMQRLAPDAPLDAAQVEREIRLRDAQLANDFSKDPQITAIRGARKYLGDKLIRVASPHRILDPKAGPLIAVKLHILTRKSLGGIQTDLSGRALDDNGSPIPGLYAAGEASGFGGGGMHGYRSLEGTFLGGCLFTGRTVGRAIDAQLS